MKSESFHIFCKIRITEKSKYLIIKNEISFDQDLLKISESLTLVCALKIPYTYWVLIIYNISKVNVEQ